MSTSLARLVYDLVQNSSVGAGESQAILILVFGIVVRHLLYRGQCKTSLLQSIRTVHSIIIELFLGAITLINFDEARSVIGSSQGLLLDDGLLDDGLF